MSSQEIADEIGIVPKQVTPFMRYQVGRGSVRKELFNRRVHYFIPNHVKESVKKYIKQYEN